MKRLGLLIISVVILLACTESKEVKRQQLFLKGNIALEERDYEKAIYYYNQSIELSDTFPSVYNNRAIAYEKQENNQNAFKDYEKALAIDPEFWEAYFNRAKLWQQTGNYKNALNDLERISEPYRDSSSFYFVKGLSYEGLKMYSEAEDAFLKAKSLKPENAEVAINLATIYYYQKEYDKAHTLLVDVISKSKHPQALNLLGLVDIENEAYDVAVSNFTEAIKLSSDPYFYNNRGYAYLLMGELEKGFEDIKYSLMKDDDNPWAYRNKGIYHFMNEEWDQAETSLQNAYERDTTVDLTNYYLGMVMYKKGDVVEACKHLYRSSMLKEQKGQQSYEKYCQ